MNVPPNDVETDDVTYSWLSLLNKDVVQLVNNMVHLRDDYSITYSSSPCGRYHRNDNDVFFALNCLCHVKIVLTFNKDSINEKKINFHIDYNPCSTLRQGDIFADINSFVNDKSMDMHFSACPHNEETCATVRFRRVIERSARSEVKSDKCYISSEDEDYENFGCTVTVRSCMVKKAFRDILKNIDKYII